jgi:hypothetical protein
VVKLLIEARGEKNDQQVGGDLRFTVTGGRWLRFAAYFGETPGTNKGLWLMRGGEVLGANLRVGKPIVQRCLTMFVHVRPWNPDHPEITMMNKEQYKAWHEADLKWRREEHERRQVAAQLAVTRPVSPDRFVD